MTDTLTIRFSTSEDSLANWASAAIRRLNHSPFSHCDLRLPDGNMLGASDSPHAPVVWGNPRGVAVRPPEYQLFGIRRDMVLRTEKAAAIVAWAMTQLGKPFDSSGLWGFLSDDFPGTRDWRNPDAWWCAEYKACSLEEGTFFSYRLPWPKNRISPTDLLLLLLMDERWINRDTFWQPIAGITMGPHER